MVAVGRADAAGRIHAALYDAATGALLRDIPAGLWTRDWLAVDFAPDGHHLVVNERVFSDVFTP
ncbi:MAG: hypothetical protein R3F60_32560 [bacterium]